MDTRTLISTLEQYYGQNYEPFPGRILADYLDHKSDRYRAHLAAEVIRTYPARWGRLPDVAIFEDCATGVRECLAAEVVARPRLEAPDEGAEDRSTDIRGLLDALRKVVRLDTGPEQAAQEQADRARFVQRTPRLDTGEENYPPEIRDYRGEKRRREQE